MKPLAALCLALLSGCASAPSPAAKTPQRPFWSRAGTTLNHEAGLLIGAISPIKVGIFYLSPPAFVVFELDGRPLLPAIPLAPVK